MAIKLEWRVVDIHSGVGVAGEDAGDAEIVCDGSTLVAVVRDMGGVDDGESATVASVDASVRLLQLRV